MRLELRAPAQRGLVGSSARQLISGIVRAKLEDSEVAMQTRYNAENPPEELLDDVRRRLAPVCSDWPAELFAAMTLRAAWLEYKYDRLMTAGFTVVRPDRQYDPEPKRAIHV
jgi:hypothetical protein